MEPIKILPHHAIHYFEVYYLNKKPEEAICWYGNEEMKQNGVNAINRVVSNPEQLVQIVYSYDEWCKICPHNKKSKNYNGNKDKVCDRKYSESEPRFAEDLGLEKVLGGKPITARDFFELMRPTYEKLMSGKMMPLRMLFGFLRKIS